MTADEFIQALAAKLGIEAPSSDQIAAILELAGTAAHASERAAAPVATWMAGVSGWSVDEVNGVAKQLAATAAQG